MSVVICSSASCAPFELNDDAHHPAGYSTVHVTGIVSDFGAKSNQNKIDLGWLSL
jgi:hypothetical protein